MIQPLTHMDPRGEPKPRPPEAKDWTVIHPRTNRETSTDVDTFEAAVEQAMSFLEELGTTTIEIDDNIGRVRYTIAVSDP